MADLTQSELDVIVNAALDRIAAKQVALATQTTVQALACIRHYTQTRDALLRSYNWPFAEMQTELIQVVTLSLATTPASDWEVGDTIAGGTSVVTATVLTVNSSTEYVIAYKSGDFTDGETLSNGSDTATYSSDTVVTPNHKWAYQYYMPAALVRLLNIHEDDGTDDTGERWAIQGRSILTDYDTVNIDYIWKVTDPTAFDILFVEVLILRLAMKLINPLAGTASAKFKAEVREELRLAEGKAKVVASMENNQSGRRDWNLSRYSG